jgi:hypothetical protein
VRFHDLRPVFLDCFPWELLGNCLQLRGALHLAATLAA